MNKHCKTMIFCDFDGTITTEETFVGTLKLLCEEKDLYEWFGKMQKGEITLRECTETLFSLGPSKNWPQVEEYAKTIRVREGFSEFLDAADAHGVPVVVISGGVRQMQEGVLAPYRDRIEGFYSCELDLSGEYGRFYGDYQSDEENMDKTKVMDLYDYDRAIAVGDQITDFRMARRSDVVFARDELARFCEEEGLAHYQWETFHDIRRVLEDIL